MLTTEEIFTLAEPFGAFQYGDAQGDKRIAFARVIEHAACEGLNAEIDRLTRERDEHARWRAELADKLHATESLVSELRAGRDAMAKDSERYRWLLRNCSHEKDDGTVGIIFWCGFENYDNLDTAIDAQIEQEKANGSR